MKMHSNGGLRVHQLRGAGIKPWTFGKHNPYSGYEQYDFEVPTHTNSDTYARYLVRMEEMRQSLRIVQQPWIKSLMARYGAITASLCHRHAQS